MQVTQQGKAASYHTGQLHPAGRDAPIIPWTSGLRLWVQRDGLVQIEEIMAVSDEEPSWSWSIISGGSPDWSEMTAWKALEGGILQELYIYKLAIHVGNVPGVIDLFV